MGMACAPAVAPDLTDAIATLRAEVHRSRPIRAWSLVVTLFGDAILPRGGELWLGALIDAMGALGIDAGAVRTATSRLTAEGWLERRRDGRFSYYRLSAGGRATFLAAADRIYRDRSKGCTGEWTVLLDPSGAASVEQRAALVEAGFAQIAPTAFIGPRREGAGTTHDGLAELVATGIADADRTIAAAWPLEEIAGRYRRFVARFAPVEAALRAAGGRGRIASPDPLEAMTVRLLLIHEFRRVVLRDPGLPASALPQDWPGGPARELCRSIYRRVAGASEAWLDTVGRASTGPLPPPDPSPENRFEA